MVSSTSAEKKVLFLHIPKTAGTSFLRLLQNNFSAASIFRHGDTSDLGQYGSSEIYERYDLIVGHVPYSLIYPFRNRHRIVTLLRNPLDRVLSLYSFYKSLDPNTTNDPILKFKVIASQTLTAERFFRLDHPYISAELDNGMCRQLTRIPGYGGDLDWDVLYTSAKETLENVVFGIVEYYRESEEYLCGELGLSRAVSTHKLNVTPDRLHVAALGRDTVYAVVERIAGDVKLYEHATKLFLQRYETYLYGGHRKDCIDQLPKLRQEGNEWVWTTDMPLVGQGWHEREFRSDKVFRWSGPRRVASLYFSVQDVRSVQNLKITISMFANRAMVEKIRVRVNGSQRPCTLRWTEEQEAIFIAPLAADDLKSTVFKIDIDPGFMVEAALLQQGSKDNRLLGFALCKIALA